MNRRGVIARLVAGAVGFVAAKLPDVPRPPVQPIELPRTVAYTFDEMFYCDFSNPEAVDALAKAIGHLADRRVVLVGTHRPPDFL